GGLAVSAGYQRQHLEAFGDVSLVLQCAKQAKALAVELGGFTERAQVVLRHPECDKRKRNALRIAESPEQSGAFLAQRSRTPPIPLVSRDNTQIVERYGDPPLVSQFTS